MWLRKGIYMTNYAMIVSYDGTRYEGWQKQTRTKETIQGKIEDALLQVTGEVCQVNGAGRTDAGVHAKGQCANFRLPFQVPADKLMDELNRALPDDIGIMSLKEAAENFMRAFLPRGNGTATASASEVSRMYSRDGTCGSLESRSMWKR